MKVEEEDLELSLVYVDPHEGNAAIELQRIHRNLKQSITHQLLKNEHNFSARCPQTKHSPTKKQPAWCAARIRHLFDGNLLPLLVVGGAIGLAILYRTFFVQNYICVCPRPTCYGYYSRLRRYILDKLGYEDTVYY